MSAGLRVHGLIPAVLALAGLAVWLMEWFAVDTPGGLFTRYAVTQVVWMVLGVYALFSTVVVSVAAGIGL